MRFVATFLSVFTTCLTMVVVINVWLDPDHRFRADFSAEEQFARSMAKGKALVGSAHFNFRGLSFFRARQAEAAPGVVVIGSSRAMLIGNEMLGRDDVVNHGMPSARLLDYLGVAGTYLDRGLVPGTVIIGADPWIFKPEILTYLGPLEPGARAMARRMGVKLSDLGYRPGFPIRQAFAFDTFNDTLTDFFRQHSGECSGLELADTVDLNCASRYADGSLVYPASIRDKPGAAVEAEIAAEASKRGRMHSFEGYEAPDPSLVAAFGEFLRQLKAAGSQVVVLLPPYHPALEEAHANDKDWRLLMDAQERIRAITADLDIPLAGNYSAPLANCGRSEFYDGIHAKESCVSKILAQLPPTVLRPAHPSRCDKPCLEGLK